MADPSLIGAEQAQLVAGGALGAFARLYLRHPGNVIKAIGLVVISTASASAFGADAMKYSPVGLAGTGFIVGLLTLSVASGILLAVDRLDFGAFLPGKKKD